MGQIGQLLGVIGHTFSIKNDHGDKVQVSVKVDCRTASDTDCKAWIVSNRIIAGQRPWRALDKGELEALNGQTFIAQDIGRKVRSRAERIAAYVNAGIPEALAAVAIDNPDKFKEIMGEVTIEKDVE